jgi:hypothetical protein
MYELNRHRNQHKLTSWTVNVNELFRTQADENIGNFLVNNSQNVSFLHLLLLLNLLILLLLFLHFITQTIIDESTSIVTPLSSRMILTSLSLCLYVIPFWDSLITDSPLFELGLLLPAAMYSIV